MSDGGLKLVLELFYAVEKPGVTFLPGILPLKLPDQLGMLSTPRFDLEVALGRVGNDARLRLHSHLYFFSIFPHSFSEFEGRQRLYHIEVEPRVRKEASWASSATVAENLRRRIRLVVWGKEAIRVEAFRIDIDLWVVKKPLDCW
jgi:hypothetical protein